MFLLGEDKCALNALKHILVQTSAGSQLCLLDTFTSLSQGNLTLLFKWLG